MNIVFDVLEALVRVVQIITLFVVSGAFLLTVVAGIYLMSEEFRDIVFDFQDWAESRQIKRRVKSLAKNTDEPYIAMLEYIQTDTRIVLEMYDGSGRRHDNLYDAVAADHNLNPVSERDDQTIERATEYHNGIS